MIDTKRVYIVVTGAPSEEEDLDVPGAYLVEIDADDDQDFCPREVAADVFHDNVPIACLDDFDIAFVAENGMKLDRSDEENTEDISATFCGSIDPDTVPKPVEGPDVGSP